MAVALNDGILVPRNPEVVVFVEAAPVDVRRHDVRIAPGVHDFSVRVEHDERRRGDIRLFFLIRDIASIHDRDVVVRVHADTADLGEDPPIRKRLRPGRVDFEPGLSLGAEGPEGQKQQ